MRVVNLLGSVINFRAADHTEHKSRRAKAAGFDELIRYQRGAPSVGLAQKQLQIVACSFCLGTRQSCS